MGVEAVKVEQDGLAGLPLIDVGVGGVLQALVGPLAMVGVAHLETRVLTYFLGRLQHLPGPVSPLLVPDALEYLLVVSIVQAFVLLFLHRFHM